MFFQNENSAFIILVAVCLRCPGFADFRFHLPSVRVVFPLFRPYITRSIRSLNPNRSAALVKGILGNPVKIRISRVPVLYLLEQKVPVIIIFAKRNRCLLPVVNIIFRDEPEHQNVPVRNLRNVILRPFVLLMENATENQYAGDNNNARD